MHFLSSLRRQGSSNFNDLWIPAFAGMTFFNGPMKEADVKKRELYHLPMWVGVFMGIALWSILADAGSRARGFYESKVAEVPVSDKAPTVLKIEGDDDDIHVYPSNRFEIKYRFFLHGTHRISPEKAAEIFSRFEVHYKNGVLTGKLPPQSREYTGAGVLYEIGLPSQLGLEVNLVMSSF